LKDIWRDVQDLFSGLREFAWNESTKVFDAEDEVWVDLIKVNMTSLTISIVNPQLTFKLN